ncbi:dolichyl-phosphate-mannose-protein mannosyltransferase [Actinomycetospora succinea]|uniref:Dolichyl-phosphate-mannose-protein mannosyltransferase n=1 Tax=Actinomycetospora succinea TaxID=663603 RepID=A0A4R6VQW8_9PSEU|nr:glycosyltransferase family 39 protein [Actinomycetospora succinea]TDQ65751.1 dolichyl-phosphate-mannose-protein mannosyltransferase [Actinomycetospora succinea]
MSVTEAPAPVTTPAPRPRHRLARRPVGVVAALVATAHLAVAWRPGWFFDEALMLAIGRDHLDWGSADQPPVAPLLAGLMDLLAPGNVLVLRLPAIAATAASVVLAALIARELGGDRRAQTLTAIAQGTGLWLAIGGHWTTPYTLEPVLWLTLGWLLVRWWRVRDDRLLVAVGVVVGVGAQTKFQILLLAAVLLASVAVLGPRAMLRSRRLWVGAVLAAAIAAPTLVWQALHGWPQLRMGPVVASEAEFLYGGLSGVMLGMIAAAGVIGVPLGLYGLWRLVRDPHLAELRYLALTTVVLYAFFSVTLGRPYYLAGLYGLLAAVGAVGLQRRREAGHRRMSWVAWPATVIGAAAAIAMMPLSTVMAAPEVADTVAGATVHAYDALPAEQRARTGVMAESYIYAAYLDVAAPEDALPPALSSNRSYGWFPPPSDDVDAVLYLGSSADELRPWFADVRPVGAAGTDATVWLATGRLAPWESFWPTLRHLDVT